MNLKINSNEHNCIIEKNTTVEMMRTKNRTLLSKPIYFDKVKKARTGPERGFIKIKINSNKYGYHAKQNKGNKMMRAKMKA